MRSEEHGSKLPVNNAGLFVLTYHSIHMNPTGGTSETLSTSQVLEPANEATSNLLLVGDSLLYPHQHKLEPTLTIL